MSFRFPLAPLLRLRQSVEHQRALSLQKASLQLSLGQEALLHLERVLVDSAATDAASLTFARSAADLQFATLVRAQLERIRVHLQNDIGRLESDREKAALAYRQAYRDCEVLECVRRHHLDTYQREQTRRQQRDLDATYLIQHWYRHDG